MDSSKAWQDSPYLVPLGIAATIAAGLTILAWRRRQAPGAYAFGGLTLALTVWSFGYMAELSRVEPLSALLWTKVQYLGIVSAPVLWLLFILETTDHGSQVTRRRAIGLFYIPLATLALAWTNERHGLIWSAVGWDTDHGFAVLQVRYGAWFWVHTAYSYGIILSGTIVLARALLHAPHLYRGQRTSLLIGAGAPWVANIVYLAGLNPFAHLDLTPFAFTVTGLALARGLLRFRLLDIVPIEATRVPVGVGRLSPVHPRAVADDG